MKTYILRVVLLLCLCSTGLGAKAQGALPDSVAEQRMVQRISNSLCTELTAENRKKPINSLSQQEANKLFLQLFTRVATADDELLGIISTEGMNTEAYGEKIGRKVALTLVKDCPVGQMLVMRLGGAEMQKQNPISATEATMLQPVANAICSDLQPRLAELRTMKPEQRQQLLVEAFKRHLKPIAGAITKQYGPDVFMDEEKMRQLGIKVAILMAPSCPDVILLFGETAQKK